MSSQDKYAKSDVTEFFKRLRGKKENQVCLGGTAGRPDGDCVLKPWPPCLSRFALTVGLAIPPGPRPPLASLYASTAPPSTDSWVFTLHLSGK